MTFRKNVNFEFAFEQLKDAFKRAENEMRRKNNATSHGILYGAVIGLLTFVEEPVSPQDDLKDIEIFQQSEKGKEIAMEIQDELIN